MNHEPASPAERPQPACNAEGFLLDHRHWSEQWAEDTAKKSGLTLEASHFEVLYTLRQQYQQFRLIPPLRLLLRLLNEEHPPPVWDSLRLQRLFPAGVSKQSALLAGLPKPKGCV